MCAFIQKTVKASLQFFNSVNIFFFIFSSCFFLHYTYRESKKIIIKNAREISLRFALLHMHMIKRTLKKKSAHIL